jgi:diguanylate cyclase (GGDEF)-like protein
VQKTSAVELLLNGLGLRALVWAASVTVGVTAGAAADTSPALLLGIAVLLTLLSATARAFLRAQADAERLQGVLEATSGIQSAVGTDAQDDALLAAARDLLPWRDVDIRDTAPTEGEVGRPLPSADDTPRWLLARPRPDSDPWSDQDDRVLETLALSASVTIELGYLQAHVAEQAHLDPLTALGNRRKLDLELQRLCDGDEPFAALVLDLDGYKSINDRLGHEAGDAVLEQVAQRLRGACRDGDVLTRLGGDEFVLLLPGVTTGAAAQAVAGKVADAVAQPLHVGFWRLRVRTSIGAAVAPTDGRTPQALLRSADQRMYDDKARNSGHAHDLIAVWQPTARRSSDHLPGVADELTV